MFLLLTAQNSSERQEILSGLRGAASMHEDMLELDYAFYDGTEGLERVFDIERRADVCLIDTADSSAVEHAKTLRKRRRDLIIVLLSSRDISPSVYLKPGITASAILLRPITDAQAHGVFDEIFGEHLYNGCEEDAEQRYTLDSKQGKLIIGFDEILYFEAREKKVFLRTLGRERGFYSTLEEVHKTLNERFFRCHRSYIVNLSRVRSVDYSVGCIELDDKTVIPLSRSCRKALREALL